MARTKKGWFTKPVITKAGPGYQAFAWNPHKGAYKSRRYAGPSAANDAENWAKEEHARLALKLSTTGRAGMPGLIDSYERDMIRRELAEPYRIEVLRILRHAVAAGVNDLNHPSVKEHAKDWLAGLRGVHKWKLGRPVGARTKNRHLEVLRVFANWAVTEDAIPYNPFLGIKGVKQEEKLKATFTVEECAKLTAADKLTADGYGIVLALQLYAGLRTGEALNMRWEWIDMKAMTLRVRQWKDIPGNSHPKWRLKLGKERVLPLQPELAVLLKPYAHLQGWVVDAFWRFGTTASQGRWLKEHCEACGVTKEKRTPHSTRHTWISTMLATGENELQVMLWAGHTELETTKTYAGNQAEYRHATKTWERGVLQFHPAKKEIATDSNSAIGGDA